MVFSIFKGDLPSQKSLPFAISFCRDNKNILSSYYCRETHHADVQMIEIHLVLLIWLYFEVTC